MFTLRLSDGGEPRNTVGDNLIRPGRPQVVVTLPDGEQMVFDDSTNLSVTGQGGTLVVSEGRTVSIAADGRESLAGQYTTFKIPVGGEYTVKLDDGTVVTMNSESELRAPVRFGPGRRKVWFRGEGYFEVAKDPARRFIVETDRAEITVTGTEFNIRSYADENYTATTLVEGSVSVRAGSDARVEMAPGTQARVSDNGSIVVEAVDVYSHTAWKAGRIVFDNARTEEIMAVLRKWYNCEVCYLDESVKERRFTMDLLKYDDITEVLDLMSMVNIRYTIRGNKVLLWSN
jgi:ferric-dicitrate binding protein FerR (iron transport regulator)